MRILHLVSHTHWDREWYRPFQEFRLGLVHLVDGLLEILDSDRHYKHFMLDGQTIVLDDYLQMRPENEDRLRRHIRNDRLIIGPWHILPDEFLVSPEATIRNLLEGTRTCRRFGPKMRIGYIPDPFGHIGQMPQILKGFDIHAAIFRRGLSDEAVELDWLAPNGSRVFVSYLRDGYDNAASLPTSDLPRFVEEVKHLRDSLAPHSTASHLLLMQGTDHMEPPPGTARAIAHARGKLDGDELVHSTLMDYLTSVQASLKRQPIPTITGELRDCKRHHLLPGCLSTRMWIKQRNQASETLLEKWAEPFNTFDIFLASPRAGRKKPPGSPASRRLHDPAAILRQAWRLLMENHPHDSICGCSVDQVHDEMRVRFDQVEQIGEELTRQALERLAASVQTDAAPSAGGGPAIVVFNPSSAARRDLVTVEVPLAGTSGFDLLDEDGNSLPCQTFGLGSRDLIHISLDPKELRALYTSVNDGRVAGMSIQSIEIRRSGGEVAVEALVVEGGDPNREAWAKTVAEIETCLADPAVTGFRVRARSAGAARLSFSTPEVPGLGWRTLRLRPRPTPAAARLHPLVKALLPLARLPFIQRLAARPRRLSAPQTIENEFFKVRVEKDGTLTIMDTRNRLEYRGLNRFLDGGDCGDEYNYCPPSADRVTAARLKRVQVTRGPVQETLELELQLRTPAALTPDRKSRLRQWVSLPIITCVSLTRGVPRVDIRTTVENAARDHRLRVHFPAPFAAQKAHHDGHFEVVERPIGVPAFDETWVEQPRPEVPQRAFTTVSDGVRGLTVANRGLPEIEVLKNTAGRAEIALTLLRCVGWLSRDDFPNRKGHAGPSMETPGAQMPGRWTFEYAVIPHPGEWRDAFQEAHAFAAPLRAAVSGAHGGSLPPAGSFLEVSPETFVVSAVKETEDGGGWLARGYNLGSEEITVALKPWRRFKKTARTNLAEEEVAKSKPGRDGRVTLRVRGHEIASVRFRD